MHVRGGRRGSSRRRAATFRPETAACDRSDFRLLRKLEHRFQPVAGNDLDIVVQKDEMFPIGPLGPRFILSERLNGTSYVTWRTG